MTAAGAAARAVAIRHGRRPREVRVLHDGSNVVVALPPDPLVARVATVTADVRADPGSLQRDLDLCVHVRARGVAAVAPSGLVPAGPHEHGGYRMTFWDAVEHDAEAPLDGALLGRSLRAVHTALEDYEGRLPADYPAAEIETMLARRDVAARLGAEDVALLAERAGEAAARAAARGAPARPVHGDAHAWNVLRTADGLVWCDFEDGCVAPVEWDLACLVATRRTSGTNVRQADAALAAYGPHDGELLDALVTLRTVHAVCWLAAMADRRPVLAGTLLQRLAWLRDRRASGVTGTAGSEAR